jgi:hypothetical protein
VAANCFSSSSASLQKKASSAFCIKQSLNMVTGTTINVFAFSNYDILSGWGNLLLCFFLWIFIFSFRFDWGLGRYLWNDIFKRVPQYLNKDFNIYCDHGLLRVWRFKVDTNAKVYYIDMSCTRCSKNKMNRHNIPAIYHTPKRPYYTHVFT